MRASSKTLRNGATSGETAGIFVLFLSIPDVEDITGCLYINSEDERFAINTTDIENKFLTRPRPESLRLLETEYV